MKGKVFVCCNKHGRIWYCTREPDSGFVLARGREDVARKIISTIGAAVETDPGAFSVPGMHDSQPFSGTGPICRFIEALTHYNGPDFRAMN